MGFLEESRTVGWLFGAKQEALCKSPAGTLEHAFDVADVLERGMARELVSDFVQPLREVHGLWKFNVKRSANRKEYRLYCSQGEFLMLAKVSKDSRQVNFYLYDTHGKDAGLYDPDAPAFTMRCNSSRTEWVLHQERSDSLPLGCKSYERPQLMVASHTREGVGEGVNHCLDLSLSAGNMRLVSKLPVWNEEIQSMVLDFKGRRIVPSAKNFQLTPEGSSSGRVVLQHAKVGPSDFGLDFKAPLSVVEAFGVALTSIFWD